MCIPHIQSVSNTKRITRIENCGAHVRVRTPTRITNLVCIVCSRMSDTRRVEGPFTIYRRRPMGFPSVSWVSPHPFILGGLCEILERDGRRPCREHAGKEKGKLSAILSGVCPRVETRPQISMTTSFGLDQPEVTAAMRSTLQPEVDVSGSSAMAMEASRGRNEWGDREEIGTEVAGYGMVSWQKMRKNHAILCWYSYGETHPTVTVEMIDDDARTCDVHHVHVRYQHCVGVSFVSPMLPDST